MINHHQSPFPIKGNELNKNEKSPVASLIVAMDFQSEQFVGPNHAAMAEPWGYKGWW